MDEKKLQEMMDEVTRGKEFNENQIREIRQGFENGLSTEQIQFYADSKFDCEYMHQIRDISEAIKNPPVPQHGSSIISVDCISTNEVNKSVI